MLHRISQAWDQRTVRVRPTPQQRLERPLVRSHEELRPVSRLL